MRKILPYCYLSFSQENVKGASNYKIIKSGRSLDLAYQLGAMTRRGLTHPPTNSCCRPLLHKRGKIWIICFLSLLFPFSAHATCTPTPDCASIGYTETSCEGDSLKCPFDTSKLYCVPCDSSFRYDCSGENIVSSVGEACGGKYVTCECVLGATLSNGNCICDSSCSVGNIYYSDRTCNSCVVEGKTIIGVVVKDNELVMSSEFASTRWCKDYVSVSMPSYSSENVKTDYDGKLNTQALVDAYGTEVDTSYHAGIYCYNFSTEGTNIGDWYLPAAGELYEAIYENYNQIINTYTKQIGVYEIKLLWSSSHDGWWNAWAVGSYGYSSTPVFRAATKAVGIYPIACFLSIK